MCHCVEYGSIVGKQWKSLVFNCFILTLTMTKILIALLLCRPINLFSMIPLWGILYGIAWVLWLVSMIGGLGSTKLLSFWSAGRQVGFEPSDRYRRGIQLSQLDDLQDALVQPD
jgi:hypothetical protein